MFECKNVAHLRLPGGVARTWDRLHGVSELLGLISLRGIDLLLWLSSGSLRYVRSPPQGLGQFYFESRRLLLKGQSVKDSYWGNSTIQG
jgi:hypothetical protein